MVLLLLIARPLGLHYYHYVNPSIRPSVRYQLLKMLIIVEPRGKF